MIQTRRLFAVLLSAVMLIMVMAMSACGKEDAAAEDSEAIASTELANPWRDVSEEEAVSLCSRSFHVPEGAENVRWSVMDSAADSSGVPGPMVQVEFDLYGNHFTAREQVTGDTETDLSGMYYDWTVKEDGTMNSWFEGMTCHVSRYIGDNEYADLCTWYDVEVGISYSLSVVAQDLDGFDIQAVAESMH